MEHVIPWLITIFVLMGPKEPARSADVACDGVVVQNTDDSGTWEYAWFSLDSRGATAIETDPRPREFKCMLKYKDVLYDFTFATIADGEPVFIKLYSEKTNKQ